MNEYDFSTDPSAEPIDWNRENRRTMFERLMSAINSIGPSAGSSGSTSSSPTTKPYDPLESYRNLGKLAGTAIASFADGGVRQPWQTALVGEEDPELVIDSSGKSWMTNGPQAIIPMSELEGLPPSEQSGMRNLPTFDSALPSMPASPRDKREALARLIRDRPVDTSKPKWWQTLIAAGLGAGAGVVNATGRSRIDPAAINDAQQAILRSPSRERRMAEYGREMDAAKLEAAQEGQQEDMNLKRQDYANRGRAIEAQIGASAATERGAMAREALYRNPNRGMVEVARALGEKLQIQPDRDGRFWAHPSQLSADIRVNAPAKLGENERKVKLLTEGLVAQGLPEEEAREKALQMYAEVFAAGGRTKSNTEAMVNTAIEQFKAKNGGRSPNPDQVMAIRRNVDQQKTTDTQRPGSPLYVVGPNGELIAGWTPPKTEGVHSLPPELKGQGAGKTGASIEMESRAQNAKSALRDIAQIRELIKKPLKLATGEFDPDFRRAVSNAMDVLKRSRTGAAANPGEDKQYNDLVPNFTMDFVLGDQATANRALDRLEQIYRPISWLSRIPELSPAPGSSAPPPAGTGARRPLQEGQVRIKLNVDMEGHKKGETLVLPRQDFARLPPGSATEVKQ